MDWKSHRIETLLEQALIEDKAASDATTNLTIDPDLRASGSIVARQEMVVAGLGCIAQFLEIYARLDPRPQAHTRFEVISHPEIFDGVRVHAGQVLARGPPQCARAAELRARDPEPDAAPERHRDPHPPFCRRGAGNAGPRTRHAQDRARHAGAREIRRAVRRRHQSPPRSGQRHSHQEQPHRAGRRAAHRVDQRPGAAPERPAGAGGSAHDEGVGRSARMRRRGRPAGQHDTRGREGLRGARQERKPLDSDRGLGRHRARKHSLVCRDRRRLHQRRRADPFRQGRRYLHDASPPSRDKNVRPRRAGSGPCPDHVRGQAALLACYRIHQFRRDGRRAQRGARMALSSSPTNRPPAAAAAIMPGIRRRARGSM